METETTEISHVENTEKVSVETTEKARGNLKTKYAKLKENKVFKWALKILIVFVGAAIYGVGVTFFIKDQNLLTGGFAGVSLLLIRATPKMDAGVWTFILNIPLIIAGLIVFGKRYMFLTILGTLSLSGAMTLFNFLLEHYDVHLFNSVFVDVTTSDGATVSVLRSSKDVVMAGICGGLLTGVGRALVYRVGSNTGGVDIIAKLIRVKYQNFTAGFIFFAFDAILIVIHTILNKNIEIGLYTTLTLLVSNFIFDKVMFGFDSAKLFYIISDKKDAICERILNEMKAGVTVLSASGGYTHDHKDVLMVAIKKHLYPKLKAIAKEEDPNAFFIVSQATEIYGKGFKENDNKKQA